MSTELVEWLSLVELPFLVPWYGDGLELHSKQGLLDAQTGYRASVDGSQSDGWNDDWIVIGNVSADPVIADVARPNTPILYAVHGIGTWSPELLAPSLRDFAQALGVWVPAVGDKSPQEEDEVRPAVDSAVHHHIIPIVGAAAGRLWLGQHWLD